MKKKSLCNVNALLTLHLIDTLGFGRVLIFRFITILAWAIKPRSFFLFSYSAKIFWKMFASNQSDWTTSKWIHPTAFTLFQRPPNHLPMELMCWPTQQHKHADLFGNIAIRYDKTGSKQQAETITRNAFFPDFRLSYYYFVVLRQTAKWPNALLQRFAMSFVTCVPR